MRRWLVLLVVIALVVTSLGVGCAEEEKEVAPTITSLNPNQGDQGETLDITITGTNFTGATGVSFGAGITVNSFTVDSSTQITADITIATDATKGTRDVSVTTPEGTGTRAGGFGVGEAPSAKPEGTLTVAMSSLGPLGDLLPWFGGAATQGKTFLGPMADWLTYTRHDGEEVVPGLAERWEISEDNMSITFYLRQGVQFHDGWGELTSEDVKFTYDKYVSPESTASKGWLLAHVESVEAPAPYEFTMHFLSPCAYLMPQTMSPLGAGLAITSKAYVEAVGEEEANSNPIYSGPYKFVEAVLGDHLTLEAVESHWRVVPEFKHLIFKEIPEELTRVAMLKTGQVDIIQATAARTRSLEGEGFDVETVPHAATMAVYLLGQWFSDDPNYDPNLPWLDKDVRRAMNLAINREEMAEQLYYGLAEPWGTTSYFPWSDEFPAYPYNPVLAEQLLEQAGYPDGFDLEMWIITYAGQAAEISDVTLTVAGYWDAIGINCEITTYDASAVWMQIIQHKTTGVSFAFGTIRYTPLETSYNHWHSTEFFFPLGSSAAIDGLYEEIESQPSLEERFNVVKQMTAVLYDEYMVVPLVSSDMTFVEGDEVGDWPTIVGSNWVLNWEYIQHPTPLGTFRLFEP